MSVQEYARLLAQVANVPLGEAVARAERILQHPDLMRAIEEAGFGPDVFVTDAKQTADKQVEISVAPALIVKQQTKQALRAFHEAQGRMRVNVTVSELQRARGRRFATALPYLMHIVSSPNFGRPLPTS